MDFRQAVINSLDRLISSGEIEKIIEEKLVKTVKEIVEDNLRSYSNFGKQLGEVVKKSFDLNGEIDLPSYNQTILKIIRAQVEKATKDTIERQVAENMKFLLEPAPETITLSKLVEEYIKTIVKRREYDGEQLEGEIQLQIKDSSYGYRYILLSEEKDNSHSYHEYFDIKLGVDKDGKVFTIKFNDGNVENEIFSGPFYGFEKSLFQMRAVGTKIIFDKEIDDIDTYYYMGDY